MAAIIWELSTAAPGCNPGLDGHGFERMLGDWLDGDGARHLTWLAELDGETVGILWMLPTPRVPRPHLPDRWTGDVQNFWIRPELRGAGLGRRMLDVMLAEADALGLERVVVHSSDGAVPLYERAGFASGRTILNRYRTPPGTP